MNSSTFSTIGSVLSLINPALGVISGLVSGFTGTSSEASSKFDKVAGQVKDAAAVVTSLAPLVEQFANGNDVTPDDVRNALAGMDTALEQFDAAIAARGG